MGERPRKITTYNHYQTIEHEGPHRLAVRTDNEGSFSYRFYDFADPKNDPKDIDEGTIDKLIFISKEMIIKSLHGAGHLVILLGEFGIVEAEINMIIIHSKLPPWKLSEKTLSPGG